MSPIILPPDWRPSDRRLPICPLSILRSIMIDRRLPNWRPSIITPQPNWSPPNWCANRVPTTSIDRRLLNWPRSPSSPNPNWSPPYWRATHHPLSIIRPILIDRRLPNWRPNIEPQPDWSPLTRRATQRPLPTTSIDRRLPNWPRSPSSPNPNFQPTLLPPDGRPPSRHRPHQPQPLLPLPGLRLPPARHLPTRKQPRHSRQPLTSPRTPRTST